MTETKYAVEQHETNHNGMIFAVKNFTPNIHSEDRVDAKRKIEERLYSIFSKSQVRRMAAIMRWQPNFILGGLYGFYLRKTIG